MPLATRVYPEVHLRAVRGLRAGRLCECQNEEQNQCGESTHDAGVRHAGAVRTITGLIGMRGPQEARGRSALRSGRAQTLRVSDTENGR